MLQVSRLAWAGGVNPVFAERFGGQSGRHWKGGTFTKKVPAQSGDSLGVSQKLSRGAKISIKKRS